MSAHLGGWSWVPFALQFRKRMQPEAWRYERTFDCCGPRDGGPSLLAVTSARTGLDSSRQVQVTLRRHAGDFDAPLTLTCMKVWSSLSARAQRVVRGSICIDRGAPSSVQGARLSASGGLPAPGNAPRPGTLASRWTSQRLPTPSSSLCSTDVPEDLLRQPRVSQGPHLGVDVEGWDRVASPARQNGGPLPFEALPPHRPRPCVQTAGRAWISRQRLRVSSPSAS